MAVSYICIQNSNLVNVIQVPGDLRSGIWVEWLRWPLEYLRMWPTCSCLAVVFLPRPSASTNQCLGCLWIEGPQPAGFVWLDKPRGLQLIKGLMSLWSWWCWRLTFWEDSYVNLKWERFDLRNFFYKFCVKYLPPPSFWFWPTKSCCVWSEAVEPMSIWNIGLGTMETQLQLQA